MSGKISPVLVWPEAPLPHSPRSFPPRGPRRSGLRGTGAVGFAEPPLPVTEQLQYSVMIGEQRRPVAHADDVNLRGGEPLVEALLIGRVQGARGFIQEGVGRVIEQHAGKRDLLLLAQGEQI